jgi:hypothetical protein
MDSTSIPPRSGCRFIAGEPHDPHTKGEAILSSARGTRGRFMVR